MTSNSSVERSSAAMERRSAVKADVRGVGVEMVFASLEPAEFENSVGSGDEVWLWAIARNHRLDPKHDTGDGLFGIVHDAARDRLPQDYLDADPIRHLACLYAHAGTQRSVKLLGHSEGTTQVTTDLEFVLPREEIGEVEASQIIRASVALTDDNVVVIPPVQVVAVWAGAVMLPYRYES